LQPVAKETEHASPCGSRYISPTAMNLLIRDSLVNPPTWFTSFRDLTLFCSTFLEIDVLIETRDPDLYYPWIKARGGMDFVEDFVRPGLEDGLRLDIEPNFPRTVVTDRIVPENTHALIGRIRLVGSL
jgi:hypothetical protein